MNRHWNAQPVGGIGDIAGPTQGREGYVVISDVRYKTLDLTEPWMTRVLRERFVEDVRVEDAIQ